MGIVVFFIKCIYRLIVSLYMNAIHGNGVNVFYIISKAQSHQHGLLWTFRKINGKWDLDLKFLTLPPPKENVKSHTYLGENFCLKT